jgi:competence protein ComEC
VSIIEAYVAVMLEEPIKKDNRLKANISIQQAYINGGWKKVTAKVRLSIYHPAALPIAYGDVCMIKGHPNIIPASKNPEEFDYSSFLSHENTYYQHQISQDEFRKISYTPPSQLQAHFFKIRKFCSRALTQHIVSLQERGIVLALVLGVKDALNLLLRDAYAGTGTMPCTY